MDTDTNPFACFALNAQGGSQNTLPVSSEVKQKETREPCGNTKVTYDRPVPGNPRCVGNILIDYMFIPPPPTPVDDTV